MEISYEISMKIQDPATYLWWENPDAGYLITVKKIPSVSRRRKKNANDDDDPS